MKKLWLPRSGGGRGETRNRCQLSNVAFSCSLDYLGSDNKQTSRT